MNFIDIGIGLNHREELLFSQIVYSGSFHLFFQAPDDRSCQHNITY